MQYSKKTLTLTVASFAALLSACSKDTESGTDFSSTPDKVIEAVAKQVAAGDVGAIWEAMPASYQSDLTTITHDFAAKLDAEMYDTTFDLVSRIGAVLGSKKDFVLNGEMGKNLGEEAPETIDAVVRSIDILSQSALSNLEGLRTLDYKSLLDSTGKDLLNHIDKVVVASGETSVLSQLLVVKATILEQEGDTATLKMEVPGEDAEEVELTQVEGRWVPADMAADWENMIAEAKQTIAEMTPEMMVESKTQTMMMVGMFKGVVDQLDQAKTQQEFDAALNQAMMPVMMMIGGAMGGAQQPPIQAMPPTPSAQ